MLEKQTIALKYMSNLVECIERSSHNLTIVLQIMNQDLRKKKQVKNHRLMFSLTISIKFLWNKYM